MDLVQPPNVARTKDVDGLRFFLNLYIFHQSLMSSLCKNKASNNTIVDDSGLDIGSSFYTG